ncbi:MAG: type II secretion system F family protein [Armatimonadetes bacterium]|nr:type II secretion system F family protein [Armatimonadota bacterium]
MPFYKYKAVDSAGTAVEGTLQARDAREASEALKAKNLRVRMLSEANSAAANAQPPRPAPVARPTTRPEPIIQTAAARPPIPSARQVINVPVAPAPVVHNTRLFTDKDLYILFTQLNTLSTSGINAVQAFQDVSTRVPRSDYRASLQDIAARAAEGRSIASVMEEYPMLYPPHVVGLVRAGEVAGFLPDAFATIFEQADANRRFKRWFTWLGWIAIACILCIPPTKMLTNATLIAWDKQEQAGGAFGFSAWQILGDAIKEELASGLLPKQLLGIAAVILFILWYNRSMALRPLRHKLALYTPGVARRAKFESLGFFSYALGMVSKAGIPPQRAWEMATASMPNLSVRDRMETSAKTMTESTKLSDVLYRSRAIPKEFAPMVQTGEMTGDVAGQLLEISRSQMEEYRLQDKASKVRVGCWMFLVMAITSMAIIGIFYGDFMMRLMQKILKTD